MFTLKKDFKFCAAHHLPHHDGKCHGNHGHNWIGRLVLRSHRLHQVGPKQGMLMDFTDVKSALEPVLQKFLDHHDLNVTIPELHSPTSEEVARWIYHKLKPSLPALVAVELEETDTSWISYDELPDGWAPGDRLN